MSKIKKAGCCVDGESIMEQNSNEFKKSAVDMASIKQRHPGVGEQMDERELPEQGGQGADDDMNQHNRNLYKKTYDTLSASSELKERLMDMKKNDNGKAYKRRHGGRSVAAAAAFTLVLLLGTGAYAAVKKWGFADFYKAGEIPETASEIVNTEVEGSNVENRTEDEFGNDVAEHMLEGYEDVVTFTPTFTVCDANMVYVGFEAEVPEDSGYFLIPSNLAMDDGWDDTPVGQYTGTDSQISVRDYCAEHDMQIIQIDGSFAYEDESVEMTSIRGEVVSPCKVEFLVKGQRKAAVSELNVPIIYRAFLYDDKAKEFVLIADKTQRLGVPEKLESEIATYGFEDGQEHRIGNTSILIREVTLTTTQLATYCDIKVKNEDESYGNWVSVHLVDEDGEYYAPGPGYGGDAGRPGLSGWFSCREDYRRFDAMPEVIHVKAHNLPLSDEEVEIGTIELYRID